MSAQLTMSTTSAITTLLRVGVVGEIAVAEEFQHRERADEIEQAVGQSDVEKLGPPGQKPDHGKQQDGQRADRVAGQHAVEDGRALDRADDGQGKRDENGGSGGSEHQAAPLESADARVHSAGLQIERALAHERMHGELVAG